VSYPISTPHKVSIVSFHLQPVNNNFKFNSKMPVKVSPLIRGARWSALFLGLAYGNVHNRTITTTRKDELAAQARKAKEDGEILAAKKAAEEAAPSILQ